MPKIIIDRDRCQGFGVCVSICPKVFKLDQENKATVSSEDLGDCDYQKAADSCPTQAITIEP